MDKLVGKKFSYTGIKIGKVTVMSEPRVIRHTSKSGKVNNQKTCKVRCSCGSEHEVSLIMISNDKCRKCPVCKRGTTGTTKRVKSLFEYWMKQWKPETHKPNTYKLPFFKGGVGEEYIAGFFYVDKEDYARFNKVMCVKPKKYIKYSYSKDNCSRLGVQYNGCRGNKYEIVHRTVINCTSEATDHINGITLDNRKYNLREASAHQNSFNRRGVTSKSGFRGIRYFNNTRRPWCSQLMFNKKQYNKFFSTKEEAITYRDCLALYLQGEFAYLNYEDKRQHYNLIMEDILDEKHKVLI